MRPILVIALFTLLGIALAERNQPENDERELSRVERSAEPARSPNSSQKQKKAKKSKRVKGRRNKGRKGGKRKGRKGRKGGKRRGKKGGKKGGKRKGRKGGKRKGRKGGKKKGRKAGKKSGRKGMVRAQGRVLKGSGCQYIYLSEILSRVSTCQNGYKFVLKGESGVRRQFLLIGGKVVLAFVSFGTKFAACTSFTDVTNNVICKKVNGLENIDLSSTGSTSATGTTASSSVTKTTAAGSVSKTMAASSDSMETTAAAATDSAETTAAAATDSAGTTAASSDSAGSKDEYCNLSEDHTMCKYDGPSSECASKTEFRELSSSSYSLIVDGANKVRRLVADGKAGDGSGESTGIGSAANMRKMKWSNELATIAQRWADQCNTNMDAERRKLDGTIVGQITQIVNTGTTYTKEDEAKAVQDLINKGFGSFGTKFWLSLDDITSGAKIYYGAAMEIGCGWTVYKENGSQISLWVCNFAPGSSSSISKDNIFIKGDTCSQCPSGTTCDDKLCG